jgi:hypothetical protein
MTKLQPPEPAPTHLAASMRVVASQLHMRRVTIDTARNEVLKAAHELQSGTAGPETRTLIARLEKVAGVSLIELAKAAKGWREV